MPAQPEPGAPWLDACRRAAFSFSRWLETHPTREERARPVRQGMGGDTTLAIDEAAELAVFAEFDGLARDGLRFTVISEERGVADRGGGPTMVVVDPVDGSLNAKRTLPSFALSIAVASGLSMGDVEFGYVHDFGAGEEFWATASGPALKNGAPLVAPEPPGEGDRLEALGVEGATPRLLAPFAEQIGDAVFRVRVVGSLALAMVYVGAGRLDGLVGLRGCRPFDVAAAQLIARRAGAKVRFLPDGDGLGASLELGERFPCVAARTERHLDLLWQAFLRSCSHEPLDSGVGAGDRSRRP